MWNTNLTLSKNRILDFVEYVDDWDAGEQRQSSIGTTVLAFSPAITASSSLHFTPLNNFSISLINKYIGEQYIDNTKSAGKGFFVPSKDGDRMLKDYFLTNISASYSFKTKTFKAIELMVYVNNLFSVQYETNAWIYRYYENNEHKFTDGYFPQAGINFMAGLNIKL